MRINHTLLGILTTAALCSTMLPLSASAGEKFQLNGGGQRKGVSDGYSYELWIDNTGGNGSMTLGDGGTFEAVRDGSRSVFLIRIPIRQEDEDSAASAPSAADPV